MANYQTKKNPNVQEKLYQELVNVLGNDGEISEQTIGRLSYLKACLKESMRLQQTFPWLARQFDYDIEVLGYTIPAGVSIMLHTYHLCRSPKHYGTNANVYFPDRWLQTSQGSQEVSKATSNKFTYLPFGYGVRMCLGRRIAEAEMYSLLSELVMNFRMEFEGEEEPNSSFNCVMKPDKPLLVNFIPR